MDQESEQELNNEEQLPFNTGKAIGANTDFLTAQSFIFQQDDKIYMYVVAGVGEDAFGQVKRVGLDCRDNIFTPEADTAKSVSEAVQFIDEQLKSLEKNQVVLAVIKNNILYCLLSHGGYIYLLRNGRLIEISKNATNNKLISGLVQPGDKVFIANSQIDDLPPTEEEIKKPWDSVFFQDLIETPPDLLDEEIEAYLQRFSLQSPIAVACLEIPKPVQPVETDQIQTEPEPETPRSMPAILHQPHRQPRAPFLPVLLFKELLSSTKFKLFLLVLILALIGLGIFGFSTWRSNSQKNAQIQSLLASARDDLNKAIAAKDSDPDGAKNSLLKSKGELAQALKLDPKNGQSLELQKQINAQSGVILKEYDVANFPVFLDLGLIKNGFSTQRLAFSLGKMALFDPKQKTLVVLDVNDKNPQILSGSLQLGDAQFADINGQRIFVYSKDKGVVEVDIGNGKADVAVQPDNEWQRISDISGFANNIYLMDEFKNQIWKYIATDKGFSARNNYLRDDATADFAGIRKMMIDGAVWIEKSGNKMLKYIQGGEDFFEFEGFETPIDNIKSFYTSDDTENIYFLDNDHGRVALTKKNGQFVGQYSGDKFKTADDLVVDEKNKKMYLLEGGKIYLIELQ